MAESSPARHLVLAETDALAGRCVPRDADEVLVEIRAEPGDLRLPAEAFASVTVAGWTDDPSRLAAVLDLLRAAGVRSIRVGATDVVDLDVHRWGQCFPDPAVELAEGPGFLLHLTDPPAAPVPTALLVGLLAGLSVARADAAPLTPTTTLPRREDGAASAPAPDRSAGSAASSASRTGPSVADRGRAVVRDPRVALVVAAAAAAGLLVLASLWSVADGAWVPAVTTLGLALLLGLGVLAERRDRRLDRRLRAVERVVRRSGTAKRPGGGRDDAQRRLDDLDERVRALQQSVGVAHLSVVDSAHVLRRLEARLDGDQGS